MWICRWIIISQRISRVELHMDGVNDVYTDQLYSKGDTKIWHIR